MLIQVKVRDISFDQFAAEHDFIAKEEKRVQWEKSLRGQIVTIETPHLSGDQCVKNGRVWIARSPFCHSLCEHQIEVGD